MKKDQQNGFFSITNQLRYGLVLLVIIPLLFISSTLTYLSFQTQIQQLEVLQQEHSQAAAAKINAYVDDLQRKLNYLARVQGLTDLSPSTQQRFLIALTRHHSAYEAVAILNSSGKIVSAVFPYENVNLEAITQVPWILYPLKYKEDFVSLAEIDPKTKEPIVNLAVPIRNQADEVNGVLLARINLKFFRYFIYQNHIGKTGYTYVIDNRNYLIVSKEQSLTSWQFQDLSNQPVIQNLENLKNAKSLVKYRGLKGVEVIGAIAPITSLRWQVIVELPVTEVYAPLLRMLSFMGVTILISIVITIVSGIWFQRQIVLPLHQLTTAAKQISRGNLDTYIKVKQRNEMGVLAATFNQMGVQLRELIQDLSQERNFVAAILDTVGALVIVVDQQGKIVRFNRACEQITKYSLAEVENKYFWEILLPTETVNSLSTDFQKLKPEQFPIDYEEYWLTKDGEKRLICWSINVLLDDSRKISYIIATGLDITERRQAEIQLRSASERDRLIAEIALKIRRSLNLQDILNTTVTEVREFLQADRVFISKRDANFHGIVCAESISPNYESLLNVVFTDVAYIQELTNSFTDCNFHKIDDVSQYNTSPKRSYYLQKYQVKSTLSVPIIICDEVFGILFVHQCSQVHKWEKTEIELLQQLATQLAIAIKQAQLFEKIQALNLNLERKVEERTAQLQEKMIELEDLYKCQDEFLHAVSHDLRTPITGTMMLLKHWQQSNLETISLPRNILDRMIESGERQLNLINSLLETHATENRGIKLNCQPVNIQDLIQAIALDIEPLLVKNQATINTLFSSNLPLIHADSLQLRRVFENLISNALNHNPPGLKITLQANLECENIRCLVQDNGLGMSEEQCIKIFERYARGSLARSTGIGLGLYLCRQIIHAHGGEIGVTSSLGSGANFWFTLPVK
jgi:PAS domain S-box-containing protein